MGTAPATTVAITLAVMVIVVIAAAALRPPLGRRDDLAVVATNTTVGRIEALVSRSRRRRAGRGIPTPRAVADWCDDIARQVRSGSTMRDALVCAAADDVATQRAVAAVQLSIERGSSIDDAVERNPDHGPHLQLALSVISTASRVGGPAAAAIDRTAMALRRRASEIDDRAMQAAQARLSTHVMTAVPLLMLAVLASTDDDVRKAAMSPVGGACIGAGLALNLAGWCWMRRIVGAGR